jgi:FkbM family methyltransferase
MMTESLPRKVWRRTRWFVRDLRPNRWVEREIRGVKMAMPWAHRLPDYDRADPAYGENLNVLAALLGRGGSINVIDVGANIGDSAILILNRTDARVLAVEPDDVYLPFLRHNVLHEPRVTVEPSLLLAEPSEAGLRSVRQGGTAKFVADATSTAAPTLTVRQLKERHPDFESVRLVKSDTDGFDTSLIPAIAAAWLDSHPVLFFEYDHRLTRAAGFDPLLVWKELQSLGYSDCAIWDNGGHPIHRLTLEQASELARATEPQSPRMFWDVAAVHSQDSEGLRALDEMVPRA